MKGQPCYRRFLLDMHVPDWDEAFLSRFDPAEYARLIAGAGVQSVMVYCQSHTGLCYYPTAAGRTHRAFAGRDVIGGLLADLQGRGIETSAYYSVIFNNHAWQEHPDWRVQPRPRLMDRDFHGARYGQVCPNNIAYAAFARAQTAEILGRYPFQGFFFDMTFWPGVCTCPSCAARHMAETGTPLPLTVDWESPAWCRFQELREGWLCSFARDLSAAAREARPGTAVFHNFTMCLGDWSCGMSHDLAEGQDFLGGDFYGDAADRLLVGRLMQGLTRSRPHELMTTVTEGLTDHVSLKEPERLELMALSAAASSAALRLIDAVDPRGTLNPAAYAGVGAAFAAMSEREPFLGGEPVQDAAVYFSDYSRVSLAENGTSAAAQSIGFSSPPHIRAARGAAESLQRAHIPFGVVTRRDLARLSRCPLLVLPDIVRMSREEADALREYVREGGALYASVGTSLLTTDGVRHRDFLLADVFGCRAEGALDTRGCALRPADEVLARAISPQRHLSLGTAAGDRGGQAGAAFAADAAVKLAPSPTGRVLAFLTLPYGHPARGSLSDHAWSSIHSDPPWTDTETPLVVHNRFGKGSAVYCAFPVESGTHWASRAAFIALLGMLLEGRPLRFSAEARPETSITAFHQPQLSRYVIHLLAPGAPQKASLRFRLAAGQSPRSVREAPGMKPVEFLADAAGGVTVNLALGSRLTTLCVDYA